MGQYFTNAVCRLAQPAAYQIPDSAGTAKPARPPERTKRIFTGSQTGRLGTGHCRAAGAGIKKGEDGGGVLEFGTEVVTSADGSLAALLGASPGASTAVSIMLDIIERCFGDKVATPEWQARLKEMIPSYGQSLAKDGALAQATRERTAAILKLKVA